MGGVNSWPRPSPAYLRLVVTVAEADTLRFWTTEEQPERLAKQEELAAAFKDKTGIEVDVIPVSESDLGTRATAAFAAGDLPDVIYHTLQYALPWAEAGILDTEAATEVVDSSRHRYIRPGRCLQWQRLKAVIASVPVDGWTQMVVYRKDLFEENGLAAPDSYEEHSGGRGKASQSAGNVRFCRSDQDR